MKPDQRFTGLGVALATPFTPSFELDLDALRRLVRHVLSGADRPGAGGAQFLVVLGSTGEAATLDETERDLAIAAVLEEARKAPLGPVPVLVGSGSNDTRRAAAWTIRAREMGADGALVVTPYYNKPTPAGLVAHYRALAQAAPGFPLVAYNVPGRTGANLTPATLSELWKIPELVAIKESSGNLAQIGEIGRALPGGKTLLSGDDGLALAAIAVGAEGLISVLANLLPGATRAFVDAARAGRRQDALVLQHALLPLMDALFLESNPIPLKAALAQASLCSDALRLPLLPASDTTRDALKKALQAAKPAGELGASGTGS